MLDFRVSDHGSVVLLAPVSRQAKAWVAEHLPDDAIWWNNAVAVEPRYIGAIVDGIEADGFNVEGL